MQSHYGSSIHLKKKFGRFNPARRNRNHGFTLDYRSLHIIDNKFFKKHGEMPLVISTLLWYLDQHADGGTLILYGVDMSTLPAKWANLLRELRPLVIMNEV